MPYIGRGSDFGVRSRFIYTATAGQTTFSGNDDAGISLAYTDTLYMDVYQNGVLLVPATDYAASTGTSVVLVQGASVDDTLELLVHDIFSVADSVSAKDGGTFSGTIAAAGLSTSSLGTSNFRAGVNAGNSIEAGGNYNTVVGDEAGTAITTGDGNTAVGYQALDANTTASDNTAIGRAAGTAITTGFNNALVGRNAGDALTIGNSNTAVGMNALSAEVAGDRSVAVGYGSLTAQTNASTVDTYNVAVGYNAGKAVTTGAQNTFIGGLAGAATTTADANTAVGYNALNDNTTGTRNVAVGGAALDNSTTASYNTAVGYEALTVTTTGANNTGLGYRALYLNTTGADNTAVGKGALTANTTGASNTVVGGSAGAAITTGIRNVCIGQKACNDTVLLTTGGGNVVIGYEARTAAAGTSNTIVMGNNVTGQADDNFTFGTGATDSNIAFGATSITAPSDVRLKEDIQDEEVGLGFINDLRPVTFQWKKEKDIPEEMKAHVAGSEKRTMNGKHNHGFIAQEVKAVIDNHNMKDGFDMWTEDGADGRQRIGDASLMPIMVKALQELSEKNDALEARLAALEA